MEKIKDEATFGDSVQLLTTWLERGDCNKRTAGNFYSMIQSTNSHVRRYDGLQPLYTFRRYGDGMSTACGLGTWVGE